MKKIKHILTASLFAALLTLGGCYDKDVTLQKLPDAAIQNLPATVSAYIGQTLIFSPNAVIGGNESEFTYKWYRLVSVEVEDEEGNVTEEDALVILSEERELELRLDDLNGYYLWLEATHVETGLTASHVISVTIDTRISHGWLMLKETASGNTEMDAAIILSGQTEMDKSFDMLAASTGEVMEGAPVAVYYQNWFTYDTGGTWTPWMSVHNCVTIVSNKEAMVWNTRTESKIAGMDDLFFALPGYGDRNFEAFAVANGSTGYPPSSVSNSSISPLINDGKAMYMYIPTYAGYRGIEYDYNGAVRFYPEIAGDYHLAPQLVQCTYGYTRSFFMAYDETSSSFVRFWKDFSNVGITKFPDAGGVAPCNNMNARLIYMGQTYGNFEESISDEGNYAGYALMQKNGVSDKLVLYGLNLLEATTFRYALSSIQNPIRFERELTVASCPANFVSADHYTLHQTQKWLYYTKGNTIGYYDIENDVFHDNIYTVPGSQVTYINYLQNNYDAELNWDGSVAGNDYRFNHLIVASTDGSNYTVSTFNISSNGALTPVSDRTFTGTGKIKTMIWLGGSLSENLYKFNN